MSFPIPSQFFPAAETIAAVERKAGHFAPRVGLLECWSCLCALAVGCGSLSGASVDGSWNRQCLHVDIKYTYFHSVVIYISLQYKKGIIYAAIYFAIEYYVTLYYFLNYNII